ncbi:hypothetical protein C3L33_13723, partial [Rhododendron williamsianum]
EVVKPVLNAYFKGEDEFLKKNCSTKVIERCKAERKAFQSQGIFSDNKILRISDVELRETKMMGDTPIIIVAAGTIGTSAVNSSFLEPKDFIDGSTLNCHSSEPNRSIVYVIDLVQ